LKKDTKLAEITSVSQPSGQFLWWDVSKQNLMNSWQILENEITPKFNKLREAKRSFLEYQKLDNELGHLKRFLAAHEFLRYEVTFLSNFTCNYI
jgi:hypothetical protein